MGARGSFFIRFLSSLIGPRYSSSFQTWRSRCRLCGINLHELPYCAIRYVGPSLLAWGNQFPPWFLPRSFQLTLKPEVVSRLPLLSGRGLRQRKNPLIVSSIRLMAPTLDLYTWRDRASKAQSPFVEKSKWSSNNSPMGKIIDEEEKEGADEGEWEIKRASPHHSPSEGLPRSLI